MSKQKEKSEVEFLRGENRMMKSQIRSLQREVKKLQKDTKEIETLEEIAREAVEFTEDAPILCSACGTGHLNTTSLGVKQLTVCNNCKFRKLK